MKNTIPKNILITGGLGYIGMELCKLYSGNSRKVKITVLDNKYYSERVAQLKRWGINFKQLDILDKTNIKNIINEADLIYHLAGITDVATTKEDINAKRDKKINEVGIIGTRNIIKLSSNKAKIIFPSTHVVFEGITKTKKNITENEIPKPVLSYSKGKYQSEQDLIKSKNDFVILRLGSVYGNSYDSTRFNIMPNLFSKITSENGIITLFSGGRQLKSLVNVIDVARCMMHVGENVDIKNEIFNCVSENLTVKETAEICRSINKKVQIVSNNNPVPNNGYSLSNKKIKSTGFEFIYNYKNSAKGFFESLRSRPILDENEQLEPGQDDFIDERGLISNYYFDDNLNMIGYVESKANTIRGNHYHPVQTQKCLLISGSYVSVTQNLLDENSSIETRLVKPGDLSTIPPNVAHTMIFLEDSLFLNLVNGEREHKNYGITHTVRHVLVNEKLANFIYNNYKTECRVCGSNSLQHYISLGLSPLANNLIKNINKEVEVYPLDVNLCMKCFNSQLSVVVPPENMFDNYLYLSSTTETFRNHFYNFAQKIKNDFKLDTNSKVLDIGSNDGIFLKPLFEMGINVIGIEPAKNVAKIAKKAGLETIESYFDKKVVSKILNKYGKVDIVTAFNVFAHADDLHEIAFNIEKVLKPRGTFIFEVQYLLDTIKDLTFDNIYHEHVNYWTVISILRFFEDHKLKVYKIENVNTHGGSIRVFVSKDENIRKHPSVNKFIKNEIKVKLNNLTTYQKFGKKVEHQKRKSVSEIHKILSEGKNIIGYGAPAKATTVLNYFGLSEKHIQFTIDDNKLKQNKYIPGANIKIQSFNIIDSNKVDYVLVLAWNFFDQIKTNIATKLPNSKFIKLK